MEGRKIGSQKLVRLFVSTMFIGGISTAVFSTVVRWSDYNKTLSRGDIGECIILLLWFGGVGILFSLVSQMGFFAYLTIHRIGLGFFRSEFLWNGVQIILILFALGDFLYFQQVLHQQEGTGMHILSAIAITMIAFLVAYIKSKQTNKHAFVPSLFFIIVVTMIEWIPGIRADENAQWLYFMLYPLIICNIYQLFMLHKLQS